jgi:hypothetical protein
MTDPDTVTEGGTLDLPSPGSPRELDEKILRYAREQAPEPERSSLPFWVKGLATASIAGVALLLVQSQWPGSSSPEVDLDESSAEMASAARVLGPQAAAPEAVIRQAASAPSPSEAAKREENAASVAEMLAADSIAADTAPQLAANEDEVRADSAAAVRNDRLSREEMIEFRKMHGRPPPESVPPASTPVVGEVPQDILDRLRDDLAQRTGGVGEPTVIRAESRVWPNGALGCPKPGINYTQALVEGYHVVFLLDGKQWDYRADRRGYFVLCEKLFSPSDRSHNPVR